MFSLYLTQTLFVLLFSWAIWNPFVKKKNLDDKCFLNSETLQAAIKTFYQVVLTSRFDELSAFGRKSASSASVSFNQFNLSVQSVDDVNGE